MPGPAALLPVQARDTEADQLRHKRAHLPERADLDRTLAELARVEADGASATAQRDELARRQAAVDKERTEAEDRLAELDKRMRSGAVTASRDLTAIAEQIESLKRRQSVLEDSELEIMVELDPLEEQVAALQARWGELDAAAVQLRAAVAEAEVSIDAELEEVLAARATAVADVSPELLATYERLRARLGGVGAAQLVGSSCGGCHLTLPASELDRIRHLPEDALVTCDQCGRILVR